MAIPSSSPSPQTHTDHTPMLDGGPQQSIEPQSQSFHHGLGQGMIYRIHYFVCCENA